MHDQGVILCLLTPIELNCYIDADFCGIWDKKHAQDDPDTTWSMSSFVVFNAGNLVFWQSKLQNMIALNSQKWTDCIIWIHSVRTNIVLPYQWTTSKEDVDKMQTSLIFCRIFESNEANDKISRIPKVWPCEWHINDPMCSMTMSRSSESNPKISSVEIVQCL
jgi:hypothetical protein